MIMQNYNYTPQVTQGNYTLSDRVGKVVASHAAVARSILAEVARSILAEVALIYTMHEKLRGYCP